MGRIRPRQNSEEKAQWKGWSAIRRNIWLWQQTNLRLCATKSAFPDRVSLMRFETLQSNPARFWEHLALFLRLPRAAVALPEPSNKSLNKKPFGYQVGPSADWSADETSALEASQYLIDERADYDC